MRNAGLMPRVSRSRPWASAPTTGECRPTSSCEWRRLPRFCCAPHACRRGGERVLLRTGGRAGRRWGTAEGASRHGRRKVCAGQDESGWCVMVQASRSFIGNQTDCSREISKRLCQPTDCFLLLQRKPVSSGVTLPRQLPPIRWRSCFPQTYAQQYLNGG